MQTVVCRLVLEDGEAWDAAELARSATAPIEIEDVRPDARDADRDERARVRDETARDRDGRRVQLRVLDAQLEARRLLHRFGRIGQRVERGDRALHPAPRRRDREREVRVGETVAAWQIEARDLTREQTHVGSRGRRVVR